MCHGAYGARRAGGPWHDGAAVAIHIRPTAALSERALLLEDPGAAMALAQVLLERPLMFNHSRGLWGYSGRARDGEPLTIQSTGIGGPSAATVLEELAGHGLRRAVRVGTCLALDGELERGELLVVDAVIAADGASRAAAAAEPTGGLAHADATLTARLCALAPHLRHGAIASTDLFYRLDGREDDDTWRALGALAVDLETAAVFTVGARHGLAVACVAVVTDGPGAGGRIEDDALAAALEPAGRLALAALAQDAAPLA
jgi:uridine phosphorylase